jgi:predicted DNA-binding transcriptional regulator AlpA
MFDNYQEVLTVPETMKILRICKNKIYELINSGEIPTFCKPHRILKSDLIKYIEGQRNT